MVSEKQLADWRYQCEERKRRWAKGRATPERGLTVDQLLPLLDSVAVLAVVGMFGYACAVTG